MAVSATLRNVHLSAQKGRLIANMVRNQFVGPALQILEFTPKKGAVLIKKLLSSAIANAEDREGADVDELVISHISVNEGPSLKRMHARAKGRGNRILKRTCHIRIELSQTDIVNEGK